MRRVLGRLLDAAAFVYAGGLVGLWLLTARTNPDRCVVCCRVCARPAARGLLCPDCEDAWARTVGAADPEGGC
jgi:hypothetical protein